MPSLTLNITLPVPESLDDEEIGQAVPDIIRALVAHFYPSPPDSLPVADFDWSQTD